MKRTSSGRGSLQLPGVLRPRNEDFTPKNRQSGGHAVRKSYIPKMGQGGSAKRVSSRKGRSSTENLMRPSLASSRFTPTRLNTPAWAPQSANRLSTDSARSSGIGTSTRKDTRYVTDPAYKTQCINKILDFLRSRDKNSYQRRTLLTPTTKDFTDLFTFIFQHLDPSYTLPNRFEEEIPKLLKKLHCPIQLTKSSLVTVGSPHTWPAVLAALAFLVDLIHLDSVNQDYSSFPSDLDPDDEGSRRLNCCIELYKCNDEDEINACFEVYSENIRADYGVSNKEIITLEEDLEEAERALESLPETAEELKQLKHCNVQYSDDLVKLNAYLQDLQVAILNKTAMENNKKQVIEELKVEEMKIDEEVKNLKRLQIEQGYSSTDLIHLKNHSQETGKEIEHLENTEKDLCSQGWNMEVELSKAQSSLRNTLSQFEDLLDKMGVNGDFSDINISSEDFSLHYDTIKYRLETHKKTAKKNTSQAQENVWKEEQEFERVNGIWQEEMIEYRKLETKKRHNDEEYDVTREERTREYQLKLEETEMLHEKIMEARKTRMNPDYHVQQVQEIMNDKKQELENYKMKEEACLCDGARFQMKVCQEGLRFAAVKKNMILEYTSHINTECDKFLEWFDLQQD